MSEFDYNFIDQKPEIVFELLMAANYLDLKALFDLCMAKVAWMAKIVPPEELSKTFGLTTILVPYKRTKSHKKIVIWRTQVRSMNLLNY